MVKINKIEIINERADFKRSRIIALKHGLRLLSLKIALIEINKDKQLKQRLKGEWFYLDGKGSQLSGYYTFNDNGELTKGKGDIEKTVYVWKGKQPLSLGVHSVYNARLNGWRFLLNAFNVPQVVASVVVGFK